MVLTTTLNDRRYREDKFVAKKGKFGVHAIGYANYTQARKGQIKLAEMGIDTEIVYLSRPFYLRIK